MHSKASLALAVAVMVVAGVGTIAALDWPWKAKLFPLVIGIPLFCLAAVEALLVLLAKERQSEPEGKDDVSLDTASAYLARRRGFVATGWILAFLALVVLLGFPLAVALFVFLYIKLQGGEGWIFTVVFTAAVWGAFYGLFDQLLHLPFPPGWLFQWLGLA